MEQPLIPIYTLREVIDWQNVDLINKNIWAFDILASNIKEVDLNYPSKVICFGLFLVKRGSMVINIDFQELKVGKNDIIYLFPNNVMEFKSFSEDCTLKVLVASIDYFSEVNLEINSKDAFEILSNNYSKITSLDDKVATTVSYNMKQIQKVNNPEVDNVFSLEILKHHFSLVMYNLANYTRTQSINDNFKSHRKEDIAIQFTNMVALYFRTHKDVQFYANQISITRTHLTRTIKDVFQKVPKQIIEDKIIAEIKILLLKNELTMTQIMTHVNFQDQPSFTKFFKKNTGFTPNAYRKKF